MTSTIPRTEPRLTVSQVAELLGEADRLSAALSPNLHAQGPDLLHGGWYTTEQVADLIGVDPSTLRRWRTARPVQGPPFVRFSARLTLYSVPDMQAWLSSCRTDPAKAA